MIYKTYADAIQALDYKALGRAAFNSEVWRISDAFRRHLEEHYETSDSPKKQLLWDKAWEHGHSAGLHEVEYWYDELVNLVK